MHHGRDWCGVSYERFAAIFDEWMRRYSTHRLKAFREGGGAAYDTIDGRRRRLGLAPRVLSPIERPHPQHQCQRYIPKPAELQTRYFPRRS